MNGSFFFRNPRLMFLAICLIVVSGLSSYAILPRMEDPVLVKRGAFINTFFDGASPSRVESLVSEKIENELSEIDEIGLIRSVSREGISTISIELRDEVMDSDPVWAKIRDRLADVAPDLPPGVQPRLDEMDFKAYALLVSLVWDQPGPHRPALLHRLAKELEDRVRAVSGTEKVALIGEPQEQILVTIEPSELASLGLSVAEVSAAIERSDAKISAGQIRGDQNDVLLQVSGELDSVQRIENIPVRFDNDGGFVRLSSIATVEKQPVDPPASLAIIDGKFAVTVGAYVRNEVRIDQWAAKVTDSLDEFEAGLPTGVRLKRMVNQSEYVDERLSSLLMNLAIGAIAVFFVIFVLMGLRNAIVVSIALPLAAMMVLFGMRVMGIAVHQMSVTGLIIALGLLIDNAIVIVEEVSSRVRRGDSPTQAVTGSVTHLFLPLAGSTLTTAFAFAPIALLPGPAGEFVAAIAINVIIAIFSSLFLAMTIIPAIAARITPANGSGGIKINWLAKLYSRSLDFVLHYPVAGLLLGMALPVAGFVVSTQLSEQFFPPAERNQLQIELELAPQSSIGATVATAHEVRDLLLADDRVTDVDWFIGESAPAFYYNLIPRRSGVSQYAQAMVHLDSNEGISELIHQLQDKVNHGFPEARVLVRQLEQGPPFDAPVEVRLFGPDLEQLKSTGEQLRQILAETPGVIHTRSEMDEVLPKIEFDVGEQQAIAAGVELSTIARQLSAFTEGRTGGSVIEATEELPVRVRLGGDYRNSLNDVASLSIVNPGASSGAMPASGFRGIPITAIAETKLIQDFGSINHYNGRRMSEIQVYIPAGVLPSTVLNAFRSRVEQLTAEGEFEVPAGYTLSYGGEAAERNEAVGNLLANVGILAVLMITTLVVSFQSFRIAGIVGLVGVLSIGLGLGALWVFGFSFGFMAIIGSMGLMGVAINDTIVVLAAIQGDEAARDGNPEAIRDVVNHSTRHIVSTSLTTMAGFSPLIIDGGTFWPPLAVAIAGGVGGATILALYFAPCCYVILKKFKRSRSAPEATSPNSTETTSPE
ncbi:MAG: efflux RND transporter permease subunit, partial [Planctomycetota bacterium]